MLVFAVCVVYLKDYFKVYMFRRSIHEEEPCEINQTSRQSLMLYV